MPGQVLRELPAVAPSGLQVLAGVQTPHQLPPHRTRQEVVQYLDTSQEHSSEQNSFRAVCSKFGHSVQSS